MKIIHLLGRFAFSFLFLAAAPRHFSAEGIQHAADFGVPLAALAVPLSGLMMVAGALSLLFNVKPQWGAWLLVAFIVPVTAMMHRFWTVTDPVNHHVQIAHFAKNLALLGALLQFAVKPSAAKVSKSPASSASGSSALA